jgi:2-oxoisovalerate dehydrogenase E1 component
MDTIIKFDKKKLNKKKLLELYRAILKPRMIEDKMLVLLRQGRISKWFSGIGQEAVAVGVTEALESDEFVFTLHRNLGVFTSRKVPFDRLFSQWQGKMHGYTKGRDRSFHFGVPEHGIVGMISHLGPQLALAGGVGLANILGGEKKIAVAFSGEGGTSEGDFHEAINVAAVWNLPVIFVIENNGYGLSTPSSEQFVCEHPVDKAIGYGMKGVRIDGNNILEVYNTVVDLAREMRKDPHPVLLVCDTFRMRGHEEASGTKYVPKELMEHWATKDPVTNFQNYLLGEGILSEKMIEEIRAEFKAEIEHGIQVSESQPPIEADTQRELDDVYAPFEQQEILPSEHGQKTSKRFVDAISDGLRQAMQRHPKLVLMGQDIAEYGGVFKITEGFTAEFGKARVRNTPLCESAIVGVGIGLGIKGYKAMMEMQFADFVTCGFNQIVNNAAKLHWRWGQNVDLVVRMPTGAGTGAGPFHSQSNEAWFVKTPGLKVLYPSNPYDAKGLLLASFEDPNPIVYFEHKLLYRSIEQDIPDEYYTVEIGKAKTVREGSAASIITYGMGVHWAEAAVKELGVDVEIIDLRTLLPLDYAAIDASVKKTNRVMLLHEDTMIAGVAAELSAYISEHLFEYLDAPVIRIASLDTAIPFTTVLEKNFLASARLKDGIERLLGY